MKTGNHVLLKFQNAKAWETFRRGTQMVFISKVTEKYSFKCGSFKMFNHSKYSTDHSFLCVHMLHPCEFFVLHSRHGHWVRSFALDGWHLCKAAPRADCSTASGARAPGFNSWFYLFSCDTGQALYALYETHCLFFTWKWIIVSALLC